MITFITNQEASNNIHQNLIEDCKRRDQKAQFQIYKLYYKVMYNTSLGIVNDPMEAEDIMQESFLVAFEQIDTYSGNVTFNAWLKSIVQNRSIDSRSKNRPAPSLKTPDASRLTPDAFYLLSTIIGSPFPFVIIMSLEFGEVDMALIISYCNCLSFSVELIIFW